MKKLWKPRPKQAAENAASSEERTQFEKQGKEGALKDAGETALVCDASGLKESQVEALGGDPPTQEFGENSDSDRKRRPAAEELPKRKIIYKRLLVLAVPIALQNFLSALLNIVDSTMVQSLGEAQMGAVLLVNQFIFIYQVIIFAIAGAGVVFISQFYGKGDEKKIASAFGLSGIFVMIVALLFTFTSLFMPQELLALFFRPESQAVLTEGTKFLQAVAWSFIPFGISTLIGISMRGMRKVIMPLIVAASMVGVNFFFNYTFMFGKFGFPELRIVGAAIGTDISRFLEMVILIAVCVIRKYPIFAAPKRMFAFTKDYIKKYLRLFIPACANEIFWVLGTSVYLLVFSQLKGSESILAAVNITQSVDKIMFVVLIGLGNAAGVVVGNEIGAGNEVAAKYIAKHSTIFSLFAGIFVGVFTALMTFAVSYIYPNVNAESVTHAKNLMYIFGVFMIFRAVSYTLIIGCLRAGGDTVFCMLVETITVWVIAVPLCLITGLLLNWPIEIIYLCIYSEEVVKMFVVLWRFKSGKWIRNLVQNI